MCIIAICKERALTQKEIENCWRENHHGAGIAWIESGYVHFKKGLMSLKDFLKVYEEVKDKVPHVVHFRYATAGGICKELTHPFEVGLKPIRLEGRTRKVLFHNGVVSDWKRLMFSIIDYCMLKGKKFPSGRWSDSRVVATLAGILNFEPETPTIITVTGEIIEENNTDETIARRGGYIYDEQTKQLRFDYRTYVKELIYIVDINETTITLNWFTIPNATYYEFYLLERDGKFKLLMTNDGCKDIAINRKTLENSTQVFIKAYKEDKELINSLPQEFWKINKETTENTATNEKQTITGKHQQQTNHSITATLIKEMKIALIMEGRISYIIKILYMPAILVLVSLNIILSNVKLNDRKEEKKKE